MTIARTIERLLPQVDNQLRVGGLYSTFSYTEKTSNAEAYDPSTGEYTSSAPIVYFFEAVALEQRSPGLDENSYSVVMDIIIIPFNIEFDLRVGLPFVLDNETWIVTSFKSALQNGVHELVLGRK